MGICGFQSYEQMMSTKLMMSYTQADDVIEGSEKNILGLWRKPRK